MTDDTADTEQVSADPSNTDVDQLLAPLDPDDDVTDLLNDTPDTADDAEHQ